MTANVIVDLETLGVEFDAVVMSVGAAAFNGDCSRMFDAFYYKIDIAKQIQLGRSIDASTRKWWAKQDQAVFNEATRDARHPKFVMEQMRSWLMSIEKKHGKVLMWGCSQLFDLTKLQTLCRQVEVPDVVPAFGERCFSMMPSMKESI